ncbi:hypothetical protein LCER1_G007060 [Lachnellula cervina]|uniref:Uncharacterized protein n=1 Tax=Lachnellula cervina TaxID=1316786 RepID=A0A7D8YNK3_9HELO|nr:hypothetical protein LCER1_G007060 [Lachnellula cervina]
MSSHPSIHPREPHPDPTKLASNPNTSSTDYTPHPSSSIPLSPSRQKIVTSICALYSGSASEEDMRVYAERAVYDDPWSFCDDRFKIAGQWYGIPKIMGSSKTLATEIVSSTDREVVFKLQQEYRPKLMPVGKAVDSLVSLALETEGGVEKVVYHKDMWNEKDYSHEGLGKVMKTLNGDYLTGITRPPKELKPKDQKQ